jgi:hypothetical protein
MKECLGGIQITSSDAIKAMDYRQLNMVFPMAKLVQEGGDNIDGSIEIMKEAIIQMDDLVSEESLEDFRSYVKNCMSRSLLDNIGGWMSSFEKKSFRLNQLNGSGKGLASSLSKF